MCENWLPPVTSGMRVRVEQNSTWVHPDVAVVCGEPELIDTSPETRVNPAVLIEVRSCLSVREILLVDSRTVHIELGSAQPRADGNQSSSQMPPPLSGWTAWASRSPWRRYTTRPRPRRPRDNRGMASLPIQAWTLDEYLSYEAGIHDRGEASKHETTWVYPDVAVVCGAPELLDTRPQTLLNHPTVLVEVLSPSIAAYDRNLQAPRYRSCPSLRELLIVDPTAVCVEHWSRTGASEWTVEEVRQLDGLLKLDSMAAEIPVAEFYEE